MTHITRKEHVANDRLLLFRSDPSKHEDGETFCFLVEDDLALLCVTGLEKYVGRPF
jgi:hypothetical protein